MLLCFCFVFYGGGGVDGDRAGSVRGYWCNFLNYPVDLFMLMHKPCLWRGRIFFYFSLSL